MTRIAPSPTNLGANLPTALGTATAAPTTDRENSATTPNAAAATAAEAKPEVAANAGSVAPIAPREANRPGELMLMQYNVENLFDTKDDPNKADEDFTPEGREHWNEAKLAYKMQNLGKVIRHVNAGRGPDILALQEVENKDVLTQLNKGALRGLGYQEPVLIEGQDRRGIDVALMTRYPLAGKPISHEVADSTWRGPSRPILEVPLKVDGEILTVFVNHWPSKRGGAQAETERGAAADKLRSLIANKLKKNPKAEILVVGDLNTDLDEAPLQQHLHSGGDKATVKASSANDPRFYDALYDAAKHHATPGTSVKSTSVTTTKPAPAQGELAKELALRRSTVATQGLVKSGAPDQPNRVGTHYYRGGKSWSAFDHVILSKGLLDDQGLSYVPGSTQVVRPDFMVNRDGSPKRFMPPHGRSGQAATLPAPQKLGFSDHFPVVARFKVERD